MKTCLILAILLFPVMALAQRLPRVVLPVHYELTFTPHLSEETFDGSERITVSVQQPTREITLHALEIDFKSVTVETSAPGSSSPSMQAAGVRLEPEKEFAVLTVPESIPPGPATIHIEYAGKLNRDLRGFYIGDAPQGKYAASQGEATDIRRAFPSFDEPAMKATYGITMIVGKNDTAISNTAAVSDTPGPGPNQHTVRFATTPRLSSYLVALLAGDYHCATGEVDSVPLGICTIGDRSSLTGFALESTRGIVHYFNGYYGIPYPFGKLDQIGIPDFAAGAMENPGAIIYRESALLSDPKTSSITRRKGIASTISHEIAHMWFGDLVTMRWWNDIWLNEGFATWMESKPLKKLHPDWRYELEETAETTSAMNTDVLSTTRPIRADATTSREIDALFDSIAYEKTASLLRMVESYIGEENFRSGVNSYLESHAYGYAESFDFFEALASASRLPADQVMNGFVNQPGVPLLEVTQRCDGNQTVVHVLQRPFLENGKVAAGPAQQWDVPVCPSGGKSCQLLRDREQDLRFDGCSGALYLNAKGSGYFITRYQPETETQLLGKWGSFEEQERMTFARDEWYLATSGASPVGDYLSVARAARTDDVPAFLESMLKNLQYIDDYWTSPADAPAYEAWVKAALQPVFKDLGMAAAAGDSEERRLARGYIWKALVVTARDPQLTGAVRKMAEQYLKDRTSLDPDVINSVLEAAAAGGDARLYDQVKAAYLAGGTPEEHRTLLYSLAEFRDPVLLQRTMDFALTRDVRNQDKARLIAAVLRNPKGTTIGWNFLKQHWAEISQQVSDAMQPGLVRSTEYGCDNSMQNDVRQFFADHPVPGSDRDLAQALEHMSICTNARSAQQSRLNEWLKAQQN